MDKNIGDEEEMKQVIIDSNDVQYAYEWTIDIGDKDEMKQVIINNKDDKYANKWLLKIWDLINK